MTLVQSWIDSLTLLKPKNAQLFIMVTLKSIIEAYKVMFFYLWIAVALIPVIYLFLGLIIPAFSGPHTAESSRWTQEMINLLTCLLYQFFLLATCMGTRPSIMKKDSAYFRSQIYVFIYLIILLALIPKMFWPTSFSPLYIFAVLFFLDSAKGFKSFFISLWHSLKMIIFNFPLLVVMGVCFNLFVWLFSNFIGLLIYQITDPFGILIIVRDMISICLVPIGVCFYANIYIKKLHDQFDLYFSRS